MVAKGRLADALPQRRDLLGHGILLSVELHERAIDRTFSRDGTCPSSAMSKGRKTDIALNRSAVGGPRIGSALS
jgi:hypothetical protein